jgi:hypothetical protein
MTYNIIVKEAEQNAPCDISAMLKGPESTKGL